jgi:hypothetical protein
MSTKSIQINVVFLWMLLFSMNIGHAQFSEGYIITLKGDTIQGRVKDRSDGFRTKLYAKIRFRPNGGITRKLSPRQIRGYYSEGSGLYESQWIETQRRFLRTDYFSITGVGQKRFLKVVVRGKLSLYHLEFPDFDNGNIDYLQLFRLEGENRFVRASQGILGLKKKLLSDYFKNYPELVERINSGSLKSAYEVALFFNATY